MTYNKEDDIFSEQELNQLEQYLVKYPDDQMIDATIDTLRQYVPEKRTARIVPFDRLSGFFKQAKNEVRFIHPLFWIMSMSLYVLGFFVTNQLKYNPLLVLIVLAPLPFVFGLLEVFRGRDANLLEMELACKFSGFEIILTRLLIVSLFNFSLTFLITILFSSVQDASFIEMLLVWFGPFTLFISVALFLSIHFRGAFFVPIFLSIWLIFCLLLVSDSTWTEKFLTFDLSFHLILVISGIGLVSLQMKNLFNIFNRYQEVGIIETRY